MSLHSLVVQFPLGKKLAGIFEPTVAATIITPTAHVGAIMQLAQDRRGDLTEHTLLGPERTLLRCDLPPSILCQETMPWRALYCSVSVRAAALL